MSECDTCGGSGCPACGFEGSLPEEAIQDFLVEIPSPLLNRREEPADVEA